MSDKWIEGLAPHHLQMLKDSAIAMNIAEARGYRTITDPAELLTMGFTQEQSQLVPCLYVPAISIHGIELPTIRPDHPRLNEKGKLAKYDRLGGRKNILDVNPLTPEDWLTDAKRPIIFTEGSRKVDSGLSEGYAVVGLLGVSCWVSEVSPGFSMAISDFKEINTGGRECYIMFDSDAIKKAEVYQAQLELGDFLEKRKGIVRFCKIPETPEGEKQGIDDYRGHGGKVADLLPKATVMPEMPADFEKYESRDEFFYYGPEDKYFQVEKRAWYTGSAVSKVVKKVSTGQGKAVDAEDWIAAHRPVQEVGWFPGMPQLIEGQRFTDHGWEDWEGWKALNTYIPPTIQLGDPELAKPFLDHVAMVYPQDAEHILDWLAFKVQNPGTKINHALLLGGGQGIGKDTIVDSILPAVGLANVHDVGPSDFSRSFNPFAKSVILRVSELRDLGERNRNNFYEHMKTYVAAPPNTIYVSEKYRSEYPIPNVMGVIYTTNNRTGGLWLPEDDRRHYVAWSDLQAKDIPEEYFRTYYQWLHDGGAEHVAALMHQRDLSQFDPGERPLKTRSMQKMVQAARSPEYEEFLTILNQMGFPDAIMIGELIDQANSNLGKADEMTAGDSDFGFWLKDRKNRSKMPHRMEEVEYVKVLNPNAKSGLWKKDRSVVTVYARTDLTDVEQVEAVRKKLAE